MKRRLRIAFLTLMLRMIELEILSALIMIIELKLMCKICFYYRLYLSNMNLKCLKQIKRAAVKVNNKIVTLVRIPLSKLCLLYKKRSCLDVKRLDIFKSHQTVNSAKHRHRKEYLTLNTWSFETTLPIALQLIICFHTDFPHQEWCTHFLFFYVMCREVCQKVRRFKWRSRKWTLNGSMSFRKSMSA